MSGKEPQWRTLPKKVCGRVVLVLGMCCIQERGRQRVVRANPVHQGTRAETCLRGRARKEDRSVRGGAVPTPQHGTGGGVAGAKAGRGGRGGPRHTAPRLPRPCGPLLPLADATPGNNN